MTPILTAASGFGLGVIPVSAPCAFMLGPSSKELDVQREVGGKLLFARIRPSNGGYSSRLSESTASLVDLADMAVGPKHDHWRLDTGAYNVPLPVGWCANVDGSVGPSVFDLIGPHNALIYIQTPRRMPSISTLIGRGQRVLAQGRSENAEWLELEYEYQGCDWIQRHDVFTDSPMPCAVTSQALREAWPVTLSVVEFITSQLVFTP